MCIDARSSGFSEVVTYVGQTAIFPCTATSILSTDWWFHKVGTGSANQISSAGLIINGFVTEGRFSLRKAFSGDASLTIRNVTYSDSGVYICRVQQDGGDIQHKFQLTVLREYLLIILMLIVLIIILKL